MSLLRPLLLMLLMLAMPLAGLASVSASACGASTAAAQDHQDHDSAMMDHAGMDHADMADDPSPHEGNCHCGCLCASHCAGGNLAALPSLRINGALRLTSETPIQPATPATRNPMAGELLRPPTTLS